MSGPMFDGLDTIALAVEHLERTESEASVLPISNKPNPSSSRGTVGSSSRSIAGAAVDSIPPQKTGSELITDPLPAPSSFTHRQPRMVSDATIEILPEAAEEDSIEDTKRIEELRQLLFKIDVSEEWETISVPEEIQNVVLFHDVLCGRGGESNNHPGNKVFRDCVKACQPAYIEATRRDKPYIAQRIVIYVRKLGGRFLKREGNAEAWKDVGNTKAREKTSQCLREGAPVIRNAKEGVRAEDAAPSSISSRAPYGHDSYRKNAAVPHMVTVMHAPHGFSDPVSHRPSKKQHRHFMVEDAMTDSSHSVESSNHKFPPTYVSDESLMMMRQHLFYHPFQGPSPLPVPYPYPRQMSTFSGSPRMTVSIDEEERNAGCGLQPSNLPVYMGGMHHQDLLHYLYRQQQQHQQQRRAPVAMPYHTDQSCNPSAMNLGAAACTVTAASGPRLKLLKKRLLNKS